MTTCAYDGKILASDTLVSGPYLEQNAFQKITKVPHGFYMFAGALFDYEPMRDAFEYEVNNTLYTAEGEAVEPAPPSFDGMDISPYSSLIYIPSTGGQYCYCYVDSEKCFRKMWLDPPMAIGSGTQFAMGAMIVGADAAMAVEAAIALDSGSGGDVVSYEVGE